MHELRYENGTDARNHVVRCSCGWAFSSTYHDTRKRGNLHTHVFHDEDRKWNDPRRQILMPPTLHENHN